jgi:hypothetical protein
MYQLIHSKEREKKKFGWMEMGIVVKIHVPIQWQETTRHDAIWREVKKRMKSLHAQSDIFCLLAYDYQVPNYENATALS